MEPRRVGLDPALLKALAHPLRLRLLGALRIAGPSTATRLAEQLGESSGLTSYHLRALAAVGLVTEDRDRGTGRDRWWRAAHDVSSFQPSDFEDTDAAPAASWLQSYADQVREREVATWTAEAATWPAEWRGVADRSDYYLLATTDELRDLLAAVHELIREAMRTTIARRDGHDPVPAGAEHVRLHLLAFPVREVAGVRLSAVRDAEGAGDDDD
jgi:DNA-binding transcriptional ArsR family regulator